MSKGNQIFQLILLLPFPFCGDTPKKEMIRTSQNINRKPDISIDITITISFLWGHIQKGTTFYEIVNLQI